MVRSVMPAEAGIRERRRKPWTPAFAGVTIELRTSFGITNMRSGRPPLGEREPIGTVGGFVMPAQAGIQKKEERHWTPAFAGVTTEALG